MTACHNLASFLKNLERFEEAKALFARALENHEAAGEPARGKLAHTLNISAQLLLEMKEYPEAEEQARRALEIDEELHGEDHPEVTGDLHCLARAVAALGRYDEAERGRARAARSASRAPGPRLGGAAPFRALRGARPQLGR